MKRMVCIALALVMLLSLAACGEKKPDAPETDEFKPALDTAVSCHITVAGGYDNFEALEAEFDRFNKYFPNGSTTITT